MCVCLFVYGRECWRRAGQMAVGRRWSWKGELPGRGGASSKSDVDKRRRSGAKVKPERRQQRSAGNVGAENEGERWCERVVWEMGRRRRRKLLCSTKRWELMGGDANVWRVAGGSRRYSTRMLDARWPHARLPACDRQSSSIILFDHRRRGADDVGAATSNNTCQAWRTRSQQRRLACCPR